MLIINSLCPICKKISRPYVKDYHRQLNLGNPGILENQASDDSQELMFTGQDTIFAKYDHLSLWFTCEDQSGNIRVKAVDYLASGDLSYSHGPLSRSTRHEFFDKDCEYFKRIWRVRSNEIALMKYLEENGELEREKIPKDILEWPARGNPYFPGPLIFFNLAPFDDADNDGKYNPLKGDLPICLQENSDYIPTLWSFSVFNDLLYEGDPDAMDIEFHHIAWHDNCPDYPEVQKGVFHRVNYILPSFIDMKEVKFGLFNDIDIGCSGNDMTGCSPEQDATFFYQMDYDESELECRSNVIYDEYRLKGDYGIMWGMKFLNQSLDAYAPFYNSSFPDAQTRPYDTEAHLNYLNGTWKDGTPFTDGGYGFDTLSTDTVKYLFPDMPNDPQGWSMAVENISGDSKSVMVSEVPNPSHTGSIDFVDYIYYSEEKRDVSIFEDFHPLMDSYQKYYEEITMEGMNCMAKTEICLDRTCVWPGDVDRNDKVQGQDWLWHQLIQHKQNQGSRRAISSIQFTSHESESWNTEINQINAKHADVDGNGVINDKDSEAVIENFLKITPIYQEQEHVLEEYDPLGLSLIVEDSIWDSDDFITRRSHAIRFHLGAELGQWHEDVFGISFELKFDSTLFSISKMRRFDFENNVFDLFEQYFNVKDESNLPFFVKGDDRVYFMMAQDDLLERSGTNEPIGGIGLYLNENVRTPNPDGRDSFLLEISNFLAINNEGDTINIGLRHRDTIVVTNMVYDPTLSAGEIHEGGSSKLIAYPNPIKEGILHLNHPISGEIYDSRGVKRMAWTNQDRVEVSQLTKGVYIVVSEEFGITRFIKM